MAITTEEVQQDNTEAPVEEPTETTEVTATDTESLTSIPEQAGSEGEAIDSLTSISESAATEISEYNLTVPEGTTMDQARLEAYTPLMRELGLSEASAQKFIDMEVGLNQAKARDLEVEIGEINVLNREEILRDPIYGGENLAETKASMTAILGNPTGRAFGELLARYGLDSHPVVIAHLAPLGKLLSEDSLELPGTREAAADPDSTTQQERYDSLYPNTKGQ